MGLDAIRRQLAQVRVSYPRLWPPGWGYSSGQAFWLAIRAGAIGLLWLWLTTRILSQVNFGAQTDQLARALIAGTQLLNLIAVVALVGALWLLFAAVLALVGPTDVTGEAIRLRQMPLRRG